MGTMRAQTFISAASVSLRNAWFERNWSFFPGETVSLLVGAENTEWLARPSPEFCFLVDELPIGPTELADIEWSDVFSPFGAGIIGRYADARVAVNTETFALHEQPAWLRRVVITNIGSVPVTVSRVAIETLPLSRPNLCARVEQFARAEERILWRSDESAVAVANAEGGWILGMAQGGAYALFEPQPDLCTLGTEASRVLPPGKGWELPEVHAFHFTGAIEEALIRPYADFLETVRNMRQWQQERLRASNEVED